MTFWTFADRNPLLVIFFGGLILVAIGAAMPSKPDSGCRVQIGGATVARDGGAP